MKVFMASRGEAQFPISCGDTKTSSKFLAALRASTHGFVFSHAEFDESLWPTSGKFSVETGALNRITISENQGRICKCDQCGLMINENDFNKHMEQFHIAGEALLVDSDENDKDGPSEFKEGDIIMVMRKNVEWPAAILGIKEGEAEVKIFNKSHTKVKVDLNQIKNFVPDKRMIIGQSAPWTAAFKKASERMHNKNLVVD